MARASTRPVTAEEFLVLDLPDARAELVRGEVVRMSLPGGEHGIVAMRIGARLFRFVDEHALGVVCSAETGFLVARHPDTVRGPDAAFVARERLGGGPPPLGFWPFAPDLAVEVISPHDRPQAVREKVRDWFASGTRRVWLLYPGTRTVHNLRSPSDAEILGTADLLSGEDLLPGFSCPVAALFDE
ncbi:MAG TPA: Uma2 family endonuclease [Thermoanaerobaculia bacterium]|jgi:Uma2 family endonuclease|nr:Uma2 family endonuclease [Thermoanaerobaculia bacterium]